jgi:hypothetical protein
MKALREQNAKKTETLVLGVPAVSVLEEFSQMKNGEDHSRSWHESIDRNSNSLRISAFESLHFPMERFCVFQQQGHIPGEHWEEDRSIDKLI